MTPPNSGADRKRRRADSLSVLFCTSLLVISLNGCEGHKARGELTSTSMDISSYARVRQRASANKESTFTFPVLEIYNDSGALVYSSHESLANAKVLKEFPVSVQSLPPQENAVRLRDVLDAIPDFKAKEQGIMDGKKSVILSTELDDCEGCRIQEQALDDVRQRILQQPSVAILEIRVSHP
jgi:hypothetical protein